MLTGFCPNCNSKLSYSSGDATVECNCCDSIIKTSDILSRIGVSSRPMGGFAGTSSLSGGASGGLISGVALAAMQGIDSPESAIIYLKNFYDRYDWSHFKRDGELYPQVIMDMVEDKKMKSGATPQVWLLDFNAKTTPLCHKLEALKELEQEMFDVYDGDDYTKVLGVYEDYSFVMRMLFNRKEEILGDLEADIKYAKEFKLDSVKVHDMETLFASIKEAFEKQVHEPKELVDEPIIEKAQKEFNEKIAARLQEKGINAEEVYRIAVNAYVEGNFEVAASQFAKIIGYSDSTQYLKKLEKDFLFNGELIRIGRKNYFLRKSRDEDYTFNVKHPEEEVKGKGKGCSSKKQPAQPQPQQDGAVDPNVYQGSAYSLFGLKEDMVVDYDTPLAVGITQVITTYAGKLLFLQKRKDLMLFDSKDNSTRVILTADEDDFSVNVSGKKDKSNAFYFNKDHTGIFFRKKLELVKEEESNKKKGCSFKKQPEEEPKPKQLNNFSLMYLDLTTFELSELCKEIVDIVEYKNFGASRNTTMLNGAIADYGDVIFYKASRGEVIDQKIEPVEKIYIYSLKSRSEIGIVESDFQINNVVNQIVIMSQWDPNRLNKNLYVLNTETNELTLIEKNIYAYQFANQDHIFYTVGNEDVNPLFSNNYEGTERKEVLKKVERIIAFQAGWMYLIKGRGYNPVLMKLSEDGQQRIVVCTQFAQAIKVSPSHVYYTDTADNLCCVKVDGSDYQLITTDVAASNVIVEKDCIHLFRYEKVDKDNKKAYSLYKVDLDGRNLKKIAFNLLNAMNYNEKFIYFYKEEKQQFEFTDYNEKGEESKSMVDYTLRTYQSYNKESGEFELLCRNAPLSADSIEIKKGCFGRKKEVLQPNYRLIPNKVEIELFNVAEAGAVTEEKEQAEELIAATQSQNKNAAGCGGNSNQPKTASTAANSNAKPLPGAQSANGCGGCGGKQKK